MTHTTFETALALALLRQRAASAGPSVQRELAYLRSRCAEQSEAAQARVEDVVAPPADALLLRWLSIRDSPSASAEIPAAGVELLDELLLPASRPAACATEAGRAAVGRVLSAVLAAEERALVLFEHPVAAPPPTLGFAQRLCDASATLDSGHAPAGWSLAVQTLLEALARAHGDRLLSILAHATRWLVTTVRSTGGHESVLLGMQPVLAAFQHALEERAAGRAEGLPRPQPWRAEIGHEPGGASEPALEWLSVLQEAFGEAPPLATECPLLFYAVYQLNMTAAREPAAGNHAMGSTGLPLALLQY